MRMSDWSSDVCSSDLVRDDLADMLMDLLTLWSEICRIDRALEGRAVLDRELAGQVRRTAAFPLASDVDHAARSAAGIFVAYILLCGLWLATGWHQGPNAVLIDRKSTRLNSRH